MGILSACHHPPIAILSLPITTLSLYYRCQIRIFNFTSQEDIRIVQYQRMFYIRTKQPNQINTVTHSPPLIGNSITAAEILSTGYATTKSPPSPPSSSSRIHSNPTSETSSCPAHPCPSAIPYRCTTGYVPPRTTDAQSRT